MATAFGWWVFPPADIMLFWDGADIFWQHHGAAEWLPLQPSAQFPGFAAEFNASTPERLADCAPPFLTALPEPGTLQIWTGLITRTRPGWHLLLRAPANLPLPGGFVVYEGILACDHWFGPLFTNLRLTRSNAPIRLRSDLPFMMIQPVQQITYSDRILSSVEVIARMAEMQDSDWADYYATIAAPNKDPDRPFGAYAVAARKRRATVELAGADTP